MNFKAWINESNRKEISQLQPNSVITVFHGTDKDTAYEFCLNGIDAKKPQRYRKFPHISGGSPIKFGLFVAPDLETAQKFGNTILKFKSLGKNLIYRFPVEMKQYNKGFYKSQYPKSFRPSVSYDMLDKGIEPQAIFVGMVSPRAIEKIYLYDYQNAIWNSMSREEYIEKYSETNSKIRVFKSVFEPQEYNISLEEFVSRLAKEHNSTNEEILNILINIYKSHGILTGIGNIPSTLLRRIEQKIKKLVNN
jgi:hypothetical protein